MILTYRKGEDGMGSKVESPRFWKTCEFGTPFSSYLKLLE